MNIEMPSPIEIVEGRVYHDPLVQEMDGETGEVKDFSVEGRNRRELVNVLGYNGLTNAQYLGQFRLDELDEAIQGYHNPGFMYIYIVPTRRIEVWQA